MQLLDCYTIEMGKQNKGEKDYWVCASLMFLLPVTTYLCVCVSGTLTEKSRFEDSEVSMVEMNSKLEHALTAKQESEAKLTGLENKVKQYEEELATLKKQVGWPLSLF